MIKETHEKHHLEKIISLILAAVMIITTAFSSRLTIGGFARFKGIPNTNMYRNFKRIEAQSFDTAEPDTENTFVPVELIHNNHPEDKDDSADLITVMYDNYSISIIKGFDRGTLKDVLEVVREVC